MAWTIRPINLGEAILDHKAKFTYFRGWAESVRIAYIAWHLTDGRVHILVDTGPADPAWAFAHRGLTLAQGPENTMPAYLRSMCLSPADVDLVICTHLHWDHCQNHGMFSSAEFVVQKRELEHAICPLPMDKSIYGWSSDGAAPFLSVAGQYKVIQGDKELCRGLTVVLTPGHTPGLQGVLVEGQTGSYYLASDSIPLFDNWTPREPIPSGIYVNMNEYYESFEKIRALGVSLVLPGHDLKVLERTEYS